mgnify:CR=1 FL=1|jgi:hypothetical protein
MLAESDLALIKTICPMATQVIDGAKTKLTFGSEPGLELLSRSKKLVLHPLAMGDDLSLDVTIYKAAIKSEMKLNYKVDAEYVYEVTFSALPDLTKVKWNYLFCIGDESAALDIAAPTITVVPADAAANVAKDITTTVQVTFSKDMDPSTITDGNLLIFQDDTKAKKAGTWAYDAATKKATFTPSAAWAGTKTFVVIVTTDVNLRGAALDCALPARMSAEQLASYFRHSAHALGLPRPRLGWQQYQGAFLHMDLVFMLYEPYIKFPSHLPNGIRIGNLNPHPVDWREGVAW